MGDNDTSNDGAPLFDTGLAFRYPPRGKRKLPIAPSHGEITNTVVPFPWPSPTACVKLDNDRFSFDSSFPHAAMSVDLPRLFEMRPLGTDGEKIAIFGHADPTGSDEYNKVLSGRRAKAVYGLLTRNPELWDQLHQQPFEGDHWGIESLYDCLVHLGYDPGPVRGRSTKEYENAMHAFEDDRGLPRTMRRQTRLALFGAYMDALVGASPGETRAYAPGDFVGEGKEPDHRGAFQGCGERNPAMVLSKKEDADLAKPNNHKRRNAVQAANRRVLIFLYAKDDVRDMSLWECPSAKAGPSACDEVAWSNKSERLEPAGQRREVRRDGKTFGCKFYDFTARISPCEAQKATVGIWLMDDAKRRLPNTPYRLSVGNVAREGRTDDDGLLEEPNLPIAGSVMVSWGDPIAPLPSPPSPNRHPSAFDADAATDAAQSEAAATPDPAGSTDPDGGEPHAVLAFGVAAHDLGEQAGSLSEAKALLLRAIEDGQFPMYAGLLPNEEARRFAYRRRFAPNAEKRPGSTDKSDKERAANMFLVPFNPDAPPRQNWVEDYGSDADPAKIHSTGQSPGEAPRSADKVADGSLVAGDCTPFCKALRDDLAGDPKGGKSHYIALDTVVDELDPGKDAIDRTVRYETLLYQISFLGQPIDNDPFDASAHGVNRNFGEGLADVVCELAKAFLRDAAETLPSDPRKWVPAFHLWAMVFHGHSGVRQASPDYHACGAAIDINGGTNPWFPQKRGGVEGGESHKVSAAVLKAMPPRPDRTQPTASYVNRTFVWSACMDAVDDACRAIYGVNADHDGSKMTRRQNFERLAIASAAVVRFLRLAYGERGPLTEPMAKYTQHGEALEYAVLDNAELIKLAVRDRLLGYVTPGSDLGSALAEVPVLSEAERRNSAAVDQRVAALATSLSGDAGTKLKAIQQRAIAAHEVLGRGMPHGAVKFFPTKEEAIAACGTTKTRTVFPLGEPNGPYGAVPSFRDPRVGFLNNRVELVEAFEAGAKKRTLAWGAVDFGAMSGDIMHFDFESSGEPVPLDPALVAFRELQQERRLARTTHGTPGGKTGTLKARAECASRLSKGTKAFEKTKGKLATITEPTLQQAAAEAGARTTACLLRAKTLLDAIDVREPVEYHAVFTAGDAATARPHRELVQKDAARTTQLLTALGELDFIDKKLDSAADLALKATTVPQVKDALEAFKLTSVSGPKEKPPHDLTVLEGKLATAEAP
jgi:hypothetical protein